MERKHFLKNSIGLIGIGSLMASAACKKEDTNSIDTNGSCSITDTETDGPYPLYNSRGSSIQRVDIRDDKTGLPLDISITVRNVNDNCNVVSNARVDIWHCDKDGYYSGYTNSGFLGTQDNENAIQVKPDDLSIFVSAYFG